MPIPDYHSLMLPILHHAAERRRKARELEEILAQQFHLTEEERRQTYTITQQPILLNRINWALSALTRAGLLNRPQRGIYEITEEGRTLLAQPPERLTAKVLQAWRSRSENSPDEDEHESAAGSRKPSLTASPAERIEAALQEVESVLRKELLERLLSISPAFFEKVVIDLLLAMGYGDSAEDAGRRLGQTGDGGVDGVIREDRLGLDLIYVQAKRYRDGAVGVDQLRAFAGALDDHGVRKGVFLTTSRFSPEARAFAERQQTKRIVLIDGETLTQLMLRHNVGVREARTLSIKRIDHDYFDMEGGE